MRIREEYEGYRALLEQKIKFSLNTQLCVFVTLEIQACVLVAWGIYKLSSFLFGDKFELPFILVLVVVSLVGGMFGTRIIAKHFIDPIKKLRAAIGKVADGDFSVHITDKSRSIEIREIYQGFNFMAEELKSTEILQSDFISVVSHEFKTPIAAIEGYSTLLQDCADLDTTQKKYVEKIIHNTKRLSDLASNILLLSKLENQSIPTNQKVFSLDEQIRQSLISFEPAWEKKSIEFDVELDSVYYLGNEGLLQHVWNNLISNAIKFSPTGGLVKIKLEKSKSTVVFVIEDEGEGISDEAKRHIFDKFYQADTSHKEEGNGLGLAMVKRVVDLEEGLIEVENRKEGGSRFTVTLKKTQ